MMNITSVCYCEARAKASQFLGVRLKSLSNRNLCDTKMLDVISRHYGMDFSIDRPVVVITPSSALASC